MQLAQYKSNAPLNLVSHITFSHTNTMSQASLVNRFIGDPADLPDGLPSRRDVSRFLLFLSASMQSGSIKPSAIVVRGAAAIRLLTCYHGRGYDTATKRSIVRSVLV